MAEKDTQIPKNKSWVIKINNFTGFAPGYFSNTYLTYGNKSQANAMTNVNLRDINVLTQGPGVAALTNGTQAGSVTTLITHILSYVTAADTTYAIGGNLVYKLSSTAIANSGGFPHTINKDAVTGETGESVCFYKGALYYFYNHSGDAGDFGKFDLTNWDDDWGSTIPTNPEALQNAPHQAILGGDDVMYFTNGNYIGYLNGTTLEAQGLDFWADAEVASITWNNNRIIAAVNRPNIAGANANQSGIYTWDGIDSTWLGDPVEVSGKIGALYTKNGITFVWWQEGSVGGSYSFGYVEGLRLVPIKKFSGSLPNFAQVGEAYGRLMWVSSNKVYLWGSDDVDLPVGLSQYMSGQYSTIGAIASTFGTILVSSYASTNYSLAKESGYNVNSDYTTIAFDVSAVNARSQIDLIFVETEQLAVGAKCDFFLFYDKGKSWKSLTQIAYSTANKTRHKILDRMSDVEDFQLKVSFINGSATNPVKIRSISILGHTITSN